jgi:hypothetical protein
MKIFRRALMPSSAPMLSEHIPPELVDAAVSNLCRAAGKAAFLGIALFKDGFGAAFAFGRFHGHACLTWAQATDRILDPNHYTDAASMSVYPQTGSPCCMMRGFFIFDLQLALLVAAAAVVIGFSWAAVRCLGIDRFEWSD